MPDHCTPRTPANASGHLATHGWLLLDHGYPIVPIVPGEKFPGYTGWQHTQADTAQLQGWTANGYAQGGVGVLTAKFPAVDIDCYDLDAASHMLAFTRSLVGPTPARVGRPPKALLPYRLMGPAFGKMSSGLWADDTGQTHKVEILADGQQYVAYAVHPETQLPYTWSGGELTQVKAGDLQGIYAQQAEQICQEFDRYAAERGWTLAIAGSRTGAANPAIAGLDAGGRAFASFKPPIKDIDLDKARQCFGLLDPDTDREHWRTWGMGLWHQFEGSEDAFELWDTWSSGSPKYRGGEMRALWASFETPTDGREPVGFGSVLAAAKEEYARRVMAAPPPGQAGQAGQEGVEVAGEPLPAAAPRPKIVGRTGIKRQEIPWLIDDILPAIGVGMIFGAPGSYKSFLALDWAMSLATGSDWAGHTLPRRPVVYIAGEGYEGLGARIEAWEQHHGVEVTDLLAVTTMPADLSTDEGLVELVGILDGAIPTLLGGERPGALVLDTLARNSGGSDENSTQDMNRLINNVTRLQLRYSCVAVVVHHTGHTNRDRARGSSALLGAVDFEYRIEKPAPEMMQIVCTKMKNSREPDEMWFQGAVVDLGRDSRGRAIDSLVFEPRDRVDALPEVAAAGLTGQQENILKLIKDYCREKDIKTMSRKTLRDLNKSGPQYESAALRVGLQRLAEKGLIVLAPDDIRLQISAGSDDE